MTNLALAILNLICAARRVFRVNSKIYTALLVGFPCILSHGLVGATEYEATKYYGAYRNGGGASSDYVYFLTKQAAVIQQTAFVNAQEAPLTVDCLNSNADNRTPWQFVEVYQDYNAGMISATHLCYGITLTNSLNVPVRYKCPNESVFYGNSRTCIGPDPSKQHGPSNQCDSTSHPIKISLGNKWLDEHIYSPSLFNLNHGLYYDSKFLTGNSGLSVGWTHDSYGSIESDIGGTKTYALRKSGKIYTFSFSGTSWHSDADISDKLVELKDSSGNRTGWTYTIDSTGEVESYDATGKLLSIKDRAGLVQTMSYSCKTVSATCSVVTPDTVAMVDGLLIKVTDQLGRSLSFTYDNWNRIKTLTNPAGAVYTYGYDASTNNLTSVTYPDGKIKSYLYGEASNVSASPDAGVSYTNSLTGIIDENNNRYANYFYDAAGRATSEYLAGNVDAASLVYNVDGSGNPTSTVVTDARGSARTYDFTTILGVVKMTGQSQPAGSGCNASTSAMTYDANGNVASRADFNGNKTTYVYDLTRNLETSRTEGLTTAGAATSATRTITTTWHTTWRLPLVISEYTGATATGTPLKRTTYVYDSKGNITSYKEEDPARTLSRPTTTTYTYSTAVPGLVLQKVVNGPRTDVTDTTTYVYYPHDATCTASSATPIVDPITGVAPTNLGCRGQRQTVTNALGQITTYDRYNHHGQVEQMTDANGLVTTNTYDLRQRLLTRTVSGAGISNQTTSLTYDGVGQITQLTLPDNSRLSYTYDAAHRLTQIQDTLGNKVVYTLDAQGNRTAENTYDPSGALAKTLTRSYDALNRLQTQTGL